MDQMHYIVANGGHLDIVEYLIKKIGCDPSIGNLDGSNALHCAAYNGHLKVVEYLIEKMRL